MTSHCQIVTSALGFNTKEFKVLMLTRQLSSSGKYGALVTAALHLICQFFFRNLISKLSRSHNDNLVIHFFVFFRALVSY